MNLNKTVLVTGGNKGIGLEVTRHFLAMGCRVIAVARNFEGCDLPDATNLIKKSFAKLLGPKGIVINAVAPGPVETDMLHVIP